MPGSYETFGKRIRETKKRVEKNIAPVVIKVVLAAHEELTNATPVKTGKARGNWKVLVGGGSPASVQDKRDVPVVSASASIARASREVSSLKRNERVLLYNNLPYIGKLNQGSSTQAPAAFVEAAISRASARDKRVKLLED